MRVIAALLLLIPTVTSFPKEASDLRSGNGHIASPTTEVQDGQTGTLIVLPPHPTETGLKRIPDADHPFIAPGPNDQRGPCPAMNALANHGYIPRNGIASFEEIHVAVMEAFNFEYTFGANIVAILMLTGGNPFINKLSIGGVSPLVPPLPGKIDGRTRPGIVAHGRFEGDASMSRADFAIGDSRNFQDILYDFLLLQLGKHGDNGPDGNNTVFNFDTLVAIKNQNFLANQAGNRGFQYPVRRMFTGYGQAAFIMDSFANGTTGQATMSIIGSFFRNETFPENWFRAASPVTGATHGAFANRIHDALPFVPGRNNEQGVYVADPPPPAPFNSSLGCAAYYDQASVIPGVLVNTTGIFKKNVDLLTGLTFKAAQGITGCTQQVLPFGPAVLV